MLWEPGSEQRNIELSHTKTPKAAMSIYIPPTNQKPSAESQAHDNAAHAPAAPELAAMSSGLDQRRSGSRVPGWVWVIAAVCTVAAAGSYMLWSKGMLSSQPALPEHEFAEIVRSISNAAELRSTVTRKLALDRAYLEEAQERNEEQMALTFQMSVTQSIEDYRNAGSNWASALTALYPFYQARPEQIRAAFEAAKARLSATQKTASNAIDTSVHLLGSVPADTQAQDYFSQQLIAEPTS